MPFTAARRQLAPTDQGKIDDLISEWSGGTGVPPQAAENLRRENGMSSKDFSKYLSSLATGRGRMRLTGIGPKAEFERVGKPFLLAGHPATPFKGAVFGRAIVLETYARFLKKELDTLKCYDLEDDIRATLRALGDMDETRAPSTKRVYFNAMRRTKLGKEVLFATFAKPIRPNQGPWVTPTTSGEIRASCALGEVPSGSDFILFTYRLPGSTLPYVPTTASPGWDYQKWFRPNLDASKDLHGWTEPIGMGFVQRPEVVHPEIDGTTLLFPIHIAST